MGQLPLQTGANLLFREVVLRYIVGTEKDLLSFAFEITDCCVFDSRDAAQNRSR